MNKTQEWDLVKKLSVQDQMEYLFDKIAGLEELVLMYQAILKIAEKKAVEFSNEAAVAVAEITRGEVEK